MLFKEIVDARTHARTDDERQTLKDHKSYLSTSCSGELKIIEVQKEIYPGYHVKINLTMRQNRTLN